MGDCLAVCLSYSGSLEFGSGRIDFTEAYRRLEAFDVTNIRNEVLIGITECRLILLPYLGITSTNGCWHILILSVSHGGFEAKSTFFILILFSGLLFGVRYFVRFLGSFS